MMEVKSTTTHEHYPKNINSVKKQNNVFNFYGDNEVIMSVEAYSDNIIRVRFTTTGQFDKDFSYAVSVKFQKSPTSFELIEHPLEYHLTTGTTLMKINKENFKHGFYTLDDKPINEDEKGFHWEENYEKGGNIVQMSKIAVEGEHFYGLGDKPLHLNLRAKRITNWGTDEYGYPKGKDPLYKSLPFYIGLHNSIAYGIFFDNTFRSYFDFASERRSVSSFWADGGEMNYYFVNGPELLDVTRRYTLLTGTPDLPPLWALGYHQCKWSYFPESQVKEITGKFRELEIPCDAIYLDIDYMDGYRCFTWDLEKFPDPKRMVSELLKDGFKTVVIIDPGIKVDPEYDVFQSGLEGNHFCRRADGPYMKGKVWPGDCYFPDFTNPKVRKWWAELFEGLIETGVRGVWNDMNEPALFEVESKTFPDDVRHDFDGNPCSHRKAHNVYGMQMARATHKGVKKFLREDNKRPFVITRSAYSGAQRYTSGWTGDNIATWEHLWVANVQCQRMSVTGFSFIGSDVGGFTEHPTPELYTRWIQLAVFHPFFRTHSSGDHGVQEPWTFGEEALDVVREFIQLRYRLLPYMYTAFYQYVQDGTPMLRPLSFIDQTDPDTLYRVDEFMCGDSILICPILEPNAKGRYVYLPKGTWYNYWTDEILTGGKETWVEASLETIPIFIKPGAVVPMAPVMNFVGEHKINKLKLHAYPGNIETEESFLYEDAGDGYEHRDGVFNIKTFNLTSSNDSFKLTQKRKGHHEVDYSEYEIIIHGLEFEPKDLYINGIKTSATLLTKMANTYVLNVDRQFYEIEIN